jgi:hypothetical protein
LETRNGDGPLAARTKQNRATESLSSNGRLNARRAEILILMAATAAGELEPRGGQHGEGRK